MSPSLSWESRVWLSRFRNSLKIAARVPFVLSNWPYFFYSRFSTRDGVLRLRNGLQFWIRPRSSDRASVTEINIMKPYTLPPRGAVVLDIGANIGSFAVTAGLTAKRVYALEPVTGNFEMLTRNQKLNGADNLHIYRLAVSVENGSAAMSVNGVTSSLHWCEKGKDAEMVQTVTLERFLNEQGIDRVDYLKMDCEGAEWGIILESPQEVLSRIMHIELEYHAIEGHAKPDALLDRLRESGFSDVTAKGIASNGIIVANRQRDFNS